MKLRKNASAQKGSGVKAVIKKIPKWLKWVLVILLIAAIVGGLIAQAKSQPMPVSVYQTKTENIERVVFASGLLEALDEQKFFTPVDSTLMELEVKLGDRVTKGQVLGRLDTLELERRYKDAMASLAAKEAELAKQNAVNSDLNVKAAESEYLRAKNKVERLTTLQQAGGVSLEEVETAQVELTKMEATYREARGMHDQGAIAKQKYAVQAQAELAQQEVAQATERLELATFVAQEDGVVTLLSAQQGNRVQEGTLLMVVGSDEKLKVTANVNEIDAGNLKVGQKVEINSIALTGQKFNGIISRVGAAAIKKQSNSSELVNVPVTITLNGDTQDLKIGYTVNLNIKTSREEDVLTLPMEAIVERDNKKIVYVVEQGVVKERQVKTKMGNELKDIVISGLKPGEKIIPNPSPDLYAGQKVLEQEKQK